MNPIVHSLSGNGSFPVYTSHSLLRHSPKHPAPGTTGVAVINGRQITVVYNDKYKAYVSPAIRLHDLVGRAIAYA